MVSHLVDDSGEDLVVLAPLALGFDPQVELELPPREDLLDFLESGDTDALDVGASFADDDAFLALRLDDDEGPDPDGVGGHLVLQVGEFDVDGMGNLVGHGGNRFLPDDFADAELEALVGPLAFRIEHGALGSMAEQGDQDFIDPFILQAGRLQDFRLGKVVLQECGGFVLLVFGGDVAFVDYCDDRALALREKRTDRLFLATALAGRVEDVEHHVAVGQALDRRLLQLQVELLAADVVARGVGEDQLSPAVGVDATDGVAGRLGGRRRDGDLHLADGVDQGALA